MHVSKQGPKRRRFTSRDGHQNLKLRRQVRMALHDPYDPSNNSYGRWQRRNEPHIDEWGDIYMWDGHRPVEYEEDDTSVADYYDGLEDLWRLADAVEKGYYDSATERTRFGVFGSVRTLVYSDSYDRPSGCTFDGPCIKCGYTHMTGRDDIIDEPYKQYPVEDHDLDYDDGYYWGDDDSYDYDYWMDRDREEREYEIERAWEELHPPYWIRDDQVDIAFEEHMPLTEAELAEQEAEFDIRLYLEYGEEALKDDADIDFLSDAYQDAHVIDGLGPMMRAGAAWNRDSPFFGLHPVRRK